MSKQSSQQEPVPATPKTGFGVAASPFNGIKIELGIVILIGFVLWLAADSITGSLATQLLLLVSYGLISAFWLIFRTRRVLQRWNNQKTTTESD